MHRYKVILEYIGAGYCGWQKQKGLLSLQQVIEEAIFAFSKERVNITVAGRTDSGVNAYGQVVHFDLNKFYEPRKLMQSINHFSRPHTIGVIAAEETNKNFHARFSATARHYVYKILNRSAINIINKNTQYWVRQHLDTDKMQEAANYLIGKHDFSSFRASECQSNSPIRTIDKINIIRDGNDIDIKISALSFLHHMVRNIVGSLILVGNKKWPPEKIKTILMEKNRSAAGPTAPAHGLYFEKVDYS